MEQNKSFCYRIAARTEAAGKYDPSAPCEGNEDSFGIIADAGNFDTSVSFDTITSLPEKGVIMVVADGMGGHNAGEVASQIAVATVRTMFATNIVAENELSSKNSRAKYLEKIVKTADQNIHADAETNPERKGMGSTIIMAWIVGNELTVTWCGDSRAYRYQPGKNIEMLSEDHSLVQEMVRKRQLTYEDTFSHPHGNIITHCLGGGGNGNAEPESRQFTLEDGDVIMLCSDGLSGVLFDDGRLRSNGEPYSEENIQDILSRKRDCLKDTLTCLFDAARLQEWYDNVTAVLFEFNSGEIDSKQIVTSKPQKEKLKKYKKNIVLFLTVIVIAVISFFAGMFLPQLFVSPDTPETNTITTECAEVEVYEEDVISEQLKEDDIVKETKSGASKSDPDNTSEKGKESDIDNDDILTPDTTT